MIPRPLREIAYSDIRDLGIPEGKTIEYKRELPGSTDADKREFLADVSSFANASGGDIVYGVEESGGLPTAVVGVAPPNIDQEKLRLENIVRSGLEPRLPGFEVHPISDGNGRWAVVLRVRRSWVSPHRVIYRDHAKFYGRNSAGKYSLDVGELRTAFTLSETTAERIRSFRIDRIAKVYARETPVRVDSGGVTIVHLVPLAAFTERPDIDPAQFDHPDRMLHPLGTGGLSWRINLDGFVAHRPIQEEGGATKGYAQLFRSGIAEAVSLLRAKEGGMILPAVSYEQSVIKFVEQYLDVVKEQSIGPPFYGFLSFAGVSGCKFWFGDLRDLLDEATPPLTDDVIVLPEVVIDEAGAEPHRVLRPAFDVLWNAFGFPRSRNYNDQGNWVGQS